MDIQTAREFYAAHSAGEQYLWDASGLAQMTDLFLAGDAAAQATIWEVFEAFALAGDPVETRLAHNFFANNPPPPSTYGKLVGALVAGHPKQAALEEMLGGWGARLDDADRAALTDLFVADPVAHFALAGNLVKIDPRGRAWDAYTTALGRLQDAGDANALAAGFEAACLAMREAEYFAAFVGRPRALVDAVAERLPSGEGDRLKAAAL